MANKYSIERAQTEAEKMSRKIESGEATNYTEAANIIENQEVLKCLLDAKEMLTHATPRLSSVAELLKRANLFDLSVKIMNGAIPRKAILQVEDVQKLLDDENDFFKALSIIDHDVKYIYISGDLLLQRRAFQVPMKEFLASVLALEGYVDSAKDMYEEIGNQADADRLSPLLEKFEKGFKPRELAEKDPEKICRVLKESCKKFIDSVQKIDEYKVDYDQIIREVRNKVDTELSKYSSR